MVIIAIAGLIPDTGNHWLNKKAPYTVYMWDIEKVAQLTKDHDESALRDLAEIEKVAFLNVEKQIFPISHPSVIAVVENFLKWIGGNNNFVEFHFAGSSDTYWTLRTSIVDAPGAKTKNGE